MNQAGPLAGGKLWVTVGQSPAPLVLAILVLGPAEVFPICTKQTRATLNVVKDAVRNSAPGTAPRWNKAVTVPPDDPAAILAALKKAVLPEGDLFYVGGTTAMVAATFEHWSQANGDVNQTHCSWYLADRAGELRSHDGSVHDIAGSPHLVSTIERVLELNGCPPIRPPGVNSRQRVVLDKAETLAGLAGSWPLDSTGVHGVLPLEVLADLGARLLTGRIGERKGQVRVNEWNLLVPDLGLDTLPVHLPPVGAARNRLFARTYGDQAGFALECLMFALLGRLLAGAPRRLDTEICIGTHLQAAGELDLTVVSGPRLTVVSCGLDNRRPPLTLKFSEAKMRSNQSGGGEARSLTVALRTGPNRSGNSTEATVQMNRHRSDVGLGSQADRDRHGLVSPMEIFTAPTAAEILQDLRDPMTRLAGPAARPIQKELAAFLLGSRFP